MLHIKRPDLVPTWKGDVDGFLRTCPTCGTTENAWATVWYKGPAMSYKCVCGCTWTEYYKFAGVSVKAPASTGEEVIAVICTPDALEKAVTKIAEALKNPGRN